MRPSSVAGGIITYSQLCVRYVDCVFCSILVFISLSWVILQAFRKVCTSPALFSSALCPKNPYLHWPIQILHWVRQGCGSSVIRLTSFLGVWFQCVCLLMMGRSWWSDLTECGPLEKGMANHFSILALRTPWTVWKGKMIRYWKRNSPGQ